MTGNPGDQIDIPSTGVTRSGYTLAGWNTKADGTGASIPAGSYTIPADATGAITLYAQWQRTNTTPTDPDANGLPDRLVNGSFEYPNDYPSYCLSNVAIHSLSADGRMDCVDWIKKDANGKPDDSKYTQKSFTINGFDQKRFGWRSSQTANSPDGRGSVNYVSAYATSRTPYGRTCRRPAVPTSIPRSWPNRKAPTSTRTSEPSPATPTTGTWPTPHTRTPRTG